MKKKGKWEALDTAAKKQRIVFFLIVLKNKIKQILLPVNLKAKLPNNDFKKQIEISGLIFEEQIIKKIAFVLYLYSTTNICGIL